MMKDSIGDTYKDMVNLDYVFTDPIFQGRGYGSTLVPCTTASVGLPSLAFLLNSHYSVNAGRQGKTCFVARFK